MNKRRLVIYDPVTSMRIVQEVTAPDPYHVLNDLCVKMQPLAQQLGLTITVERDGE